MRPRHFFHSFVALSALTTLSAGYASAAIILQDSFTNFSGTNVSLAGSEPEIGPENSTGGAATWVADATYTRTLDGRLRNNATTNTGRSATIGFGTGHFANNPGIYTLSADIFFEAGLNGSAVWGLGFSEQQSGSEDQSMANGGGGGVYYGKPWVFFRENGTLAGRNNASSNNVYNGSSGAFPAGNVYSLKLVLDTSLPNWVLSVFVNNTQVDLLGDATMNYTMSPNAALSAVGFTTTEVNGRGYVDNILLDFQAIPEPSSLALTGFGVLGLSFCRRRKGRSLSC